MKKLLVQAGWVMVWLAAIVVAAGAVPTITKRLIEVDDFDLTQADGGAPDNATVATSTGGTMSLRKPHGGMFPWTNEYNRIIRPQGATGNSTGRIQNYTFGAAAHTDNGYFNYGLANYLFDNQVINVKDPRIGAKGDGVTNDRTAIQAAIDLAKANGGGVILFPPGNYYVGSYNSNTTIFSATALNDTTFQFNGAKITFTITSTAIDVPLLDLTNSSRLRFINFKAITTGFDVTTGFGPYGIRIWATGNYQDTDLEDFYYENVYLEGFQGTLTWGSADTTPWVKGPGGKGTRRIKNIRLVNGIFKNVYYGPNFQSAGDNFIGDWTATNVRRVYYPFGVKNHDIRVRVSNDNASYASDALFAIAAVPWGAVADNVIQERPTENIRLITWVDGNRDYWSNLVTFYQIEANGGSQIIQKVHAEVFIDNTSTREATGSIFVFKNHKAAGAAESNLPTSSQWNDIYVDAMLSDGWATDHYFPLVRFGASSTTRESRVTIGPNSRYIFGRNTEDPGSDYSIYKTDNWRIRYGGDGNTYWKFKFGDLTATPMTIDMSDFYGSAFAVKLKIYAKGDKDFIGEKVTYKEVLAYGYDPGSRVVVIDNQATLHSSFVNTESAITVAASGAEGINISFTNYNAATSKAVVAVENIWPFYPQK